MQLDAQLWSDLLWLSGGLLELSKCSFHNLHFDFAPDGTAIPRGRIFGSPLQIKDELTNQEVTIPAKSVYTAHKTLGHHKAPAGMNNTQLQALTIQSDAYAKMIFTSPCNRMDSWFFYTAIYLKSIGYVLPNCFFLDKALKKVQQPALRAFLAKCGFNRNTHRAIVFAPIRFGGSGFIHLYFLQGEGQILTFLKHWRTATEASTLLRIAVSWTQLHVGTSTCFLRDPTTHLPHMPGRWLRSLRTFLACIGGSLQLDKVFLPPLQRHLDVYIMDAVLTSSWFSDHEIQQINHCRTHLQAVTLSDLCTADGGYFDRSMLSGFPSTSSSTTSWIQINQARPHAASWKLWRKACTLWGPSTKLTIPLGAWLYPASALRRHWPFYFDHHNGDLFVRQGIGFVRCVAVDPIRYAPISTLTWSPTSTSTPVHARQAIQGDFWIPNIPTRPPLPPATPISGTFSEFLDGLDHWEHELFADLSFKVDCFEFVHLINSEILADKAVHLLTVSDGSNDSGSMSFRWVIVLPCGRCLARCAGPAYGPTGSSF